MRYLKSTFHCQTFRVLIFLLLLISFHTSFSQNNRISVSSTYNMPIGALVWSYSPGLGAKLNYSAIRQRKTGFRASGISIGYTQLKPLADTLYYVVDHGGQGATGNGAGIGIALYSPFKMFHLEGTFDLGIPLGDRVFFTPGIRIGLLYGKRVASFTDSFGAGDGFDEFVTWATVNPQAGLEFKLSDHISTTAFVAYTFIVQAGSTNPDAINYNENTGMIYHYYSPGLSLNFSF